MHNFESPHAEQHKSHRSPWLRAAVLGVDDGLVSVSSVMLGVLAATASETAILASGIAALVAGALSMAAGEYVSVSSQRDSEQADIEIERRSIAENPEAELAELAHIYEQRGLDAKLAKQVAEQLHAHDAVAAHARDELGIDHDSLPNPLQAAFASAIAFAIGGAVPMIAALIVRGAEGAWVITVVSLAALAISGAVGAIIGGGHRLLAGLRVFLGGGAAMLVTYLIGHLLGVAGI